MGRDFEIGDIVAILNNGVTYSIWNTLAKDLQASNWSSGRLFNRGRVCKIKNIVKQGYIVSDGTRVNKDIALVVDEVTDEEILIELRGLRLIEKNNPVLKAKIRTWCGMQYYLRNTK